MVLQRPGGVGDAGLSLDAIDYGQRGDDLTLSGRADPGKKVWVYLDNEFVGRAIADERGIWRLQPGIDIPTSYTACAWIKSGPMERRLHA